MLCLSKKSEYALIALGYLAERSGEIVSAREIAERFELPLPLLMNILKSLNRSGWLDSARGVRGGYRIGRALENVSLHELIQAIDGDGSSLGKGLIEVHEDAAGHDHRPLSTRAAVHALNLRLVRFLKDVKLVDLIMPGRRIDVPVERLSRRLSASTAGVAITN
jgi:Rrf2 family protein